MALPDRLRGLSRIFSALSPKQRRALLVWLVFAFFVAGFIGIASIVCIAIDRNGQAIDNALRAMSWTDKRAIATTVDADSITLRQEGPDSLKNCVVTVNKEFVYQTGSIARYAILPLREFALPNGLRFDTRRYKVNSVLLNCDGILRSLELQR